MSQETIKLNCVSRHSSHTGLMAHKWGSPVSRGLDDPELAVVLTA
jgi:hypothetical protein